MLVTIFLIKLYKALIVKEIHLDSFDTDVVKYDFLRNIVFIKKQINSYFLIKMFIYVTNS